MPFSRSAGVLLHPTSLPGPHGVGDIGKPAHRFVEFLEHAGVTLWQVLPLGPTGYADSPYQATSSFAGNPLLISLELLVDDELLEPEEISSFGSFQEGKVDFDSVKEAKEDALRKAFDRFSTPGKKPAMKKQFEEFCEDQKDWLGDYALFVALKGDFEGLPWVEWPDRDLAMHNESALEKAREKLSDEIGFQSFCQFIFFQQWDALHKYAASHGIKLVGDVPLYTAHDSSDVWGEPECFELDEDGMPTLMAGVPPDYFSPTGQLWGNPIYKWDFLKKSGYDWWIRRVKAVLSLVDIIRIDHFRGFEAYWQVKAGEETAVNGKWIKGPGIDFFNTLKKELGELPIIAEDLGTITPEVDALRLEAGLPGMKVLQFAFCDGAEHYLPHNYEHNCVVYTATHDNDTTWGWYNAEGEDYAHMDLTTIRQERDRARRYLGRDGTDIAWSLMRLALSSPADMAICPMQDILNLGNESRMNRPGINSGQWSWRMTDVQMASAPAGALREMVEAYERIPEGMKKANKKDTATIKKNKDQA